MTAEKELIMVTGAEGVRTGERGKMPKLTMRSIMSEKGIWATGAARPAKAFKWVTGRLEEILESTAGENKGKVLGTLRASPPAFVVAEAEAEGARMRIVRLLGE
eukprot:1805351-Heterocapsa_arctica.AAC.1